MNGATINILIAEPDEPTVRDTIETLSKVEDLAITGSVGEGSAVVGRVQSEEPDVLLMSCNFSDYDELVQTVVAQFPGVACILLSDHSEDGLYRRAMQIGARDLLTQPLEPLPTADAIYQAVDLERQRKEALRQDQGQKTKQMTQQEAVADILAVFSTKGGVGKTTIATNMAVNMAETTGYRVLLWDLDLHFGNLALNLNVEPRRPLHQLINEINTLDIDLLESYLVEHESGLKVLPSTENPEYAELVSGEHTAKILAILNQHYDYIIVDSPSYFSDPIITVLDAADKILLIAALDLGTIRNLKSCLSILDSFHYPKSKMDLILNRSSQKYGVTPNDLKATLDMNITATLPTDEKLAMTAVNQGVPFVTSAPNAQISKSIESLVKQLLGKEKKSLLARTVGLFTGGAAAEKGS